MNEHELNLERATLENASVMMCLQLHLPGDWRLVRRAVNGAQAILVAWKVYPDPRLGLEQGPRHQDNAVGRCISLPFPRHIG
jgi:hypothetical protein